MAYDSAVNIINDAAVEIGLGAMPDPFSSTDPNFIQLCVFLKSVGRDLIRAKDWSHLQNEYTFTTVSGQGTYSLPADFRKMIDQTGWNRGGLTPITGPLSAQQWQFVKGSPLGISTTILFRQWLGQIAVAGTVPASQNITFEYVSTYWVSSNSAYVAKYPPLPYWQPLTVYGGYPCVVVNAGNVYSLALSGSPGTIYTSGDVPGPTGTGFGLGAGGVFEPSGGNEWSYLGAAPGITTPPAWQPTTAYAQYAQVSKGSLAYIALVSGTSGTVGPHWSGGITGQAALVTDGTVQWECLGQPAALAQNDYPPNADAPVNPQDRILFDPQLVVRGLKLAFLRAKGFDSVAAQQDFEAILAQAIAEDSPASILGIGGRREDLHLLDASNLPPTGYGG